LPFLCLSLLVYNFRIIGLCNIFFSACRPTSSINTLNKSFIVSAILWYIVYYKAVVHINFIHYYK
jgi:hypothetical protein